MEEQHTNTREGERKTAPESSAEEHTSAQQPAEAAFTKARVSLEDGGVDEFKAFAIAGYLLPLLFFVPLLSEKGKHSTFARFHANQQLILFIAIVILYVAMRGLFMYSLFMFMPLIAPLFMLAQLGILVLVILGIINAAQGKMKPLPLIGKFQLISENSA